MRLSTRLYLYVLFYSISFAGAVLAILIRSPFWSVFNGICMLFNARGISTIVEALEENYDSRDNS